MGNVRFKVEVIDNQTGKGKRVWGDVNPATGKIEGDYGSKSTGAIHEKDSVITEENGYINIVTLPKGMSPMAYIENRMKKLKKYKQ